MPSYIEEFNACDSQYNMQPKEDSEAISSDGEFNAAKYMQVIDDDCTEAF